MWKKNVCVCVWERERESETVEFQKYSELQVMSRTHYMFYDTFPWSSLILLLKCVWLAVNAVLDRRGSLALCFCSTLSSCLSRWRQIDWWWSEAVSAVSVDVMRSGTLSALITCIRALLTAAGLVHSHTFTLCWERRVCPGLSWRSRSDWWTHTHCYHLCSDVCINCVFDIFLHRSGLLSN